MLTKISFLVYMWTDLLDYQNPSLVLFIEKMVYVFVHKSFPSLTELAILTTIRRQ